jgi:xylulokinase
MTSTQGRPSSGGADAVVIGIDIGTTNAKGVASLADGTIVAEASREHEVSSPHAGWFEHDAETAWWGDTVAICRSLVEQVGSPERVCGVAVTTCGPCLVPVDAAGRPLRPAILYGVDTRAAGEIAAFESTIGRRAIVALGRMRLTSQSVGPKIAWVIRHEPKVAQRTVRWHTATSFLVERLTGASIIDHHQASFFGPFIDARRRAWDLRHGTALDLDGRLPELGWPSDIAGAVTASAASATGLPAGIPVLVGTSDGPTEALAVGATRPGVVAATYGSTSTLTTFGATQRPTPAPLWDSEGWAPEQRCLAAGMSTTGAIVSWLRREFTPDVPHDALAAEAAASPPGARGLLVLPYFSGERTPFADPSARGVVVGLTLLHTRADIHRAILEGIAYGVRHILETFTDAGIAVDTIRTSGGGTRSPVGMQVVADVTGREQVVARATNGAAYGAAYLAATALGLIVPDEGEPDPSGVPAQRADTWFRSDRRVIPDPSTTAVYDRGYALFRRLYRDTRPVVHALAAAAGPGGPG